LILKDISNEINGNAGLVKSIKEVRSLEMLEPATKGWGIKVFRGEKFSERVPLLESWQRFFLYDRQSGRGLIIDGGGDPKKKAEVSMYWI